MTQVRTLFRKSMGKHVASAAILVVLVAPAAANAERSGSSYNEYLSSTRTMTPAMTRQVERFTSRAVIPAQPSSYSSQYEPESAASRQQVRSQRARDSAIMAARAARNAANCN